MLLFVLPMIVGCVSSPVVVYRQQTTGNNTLKITKVVCIQGFDSEDRTNVLDALHAWETALNGSFSFSEGVENCDWQIQSAGPDNPFAAMHPRALAYTANDYGVSVFRGRIHGQEKFKTVIAHELGHMFYVEHSPDNRGLMAASYNPSFGRSCIDEYAVQSACRINQLDCENTKPCINGER